VSIICIGILFGRGKVIKLYGLLENIFDLHSSHFLVEMADPERPIISFKSQALQFPPIHVGLLPFENQKSASWQGK